MINRKSLARDVFDTFATHSALVHDVIIQTAGRSLNGSTHGRVLLASGKSIFNKRDQKSSGKLLCVYFVQISVHKARDNNNNGNL